MAEGHPLRRILYLHYSKPSASNSCHRADPSAQYLCNYLKQNNFPILSRNIHGQIVTNRYALPIATGVALAYNKSTSPQG